MKKEVKNQKRKNVKQDAEIKILRAELDKLKKMKKNARYVSEYNLFIKRQIKSGLTFLQAAKQWHKYNALRTSTKRRPSAYNQFIGSQMRIGKTFKQAVILWNLAKKGKLGRKGETKIKIRIKKIRVKSKPKIIVVKEKQKSRKPSQKTVFVKERTPNINIYVDKTRVKSRPRRKKATVKKKVPSVKIYINKRRVKTKKPRKRAPGTKIYIKNIIGKTKKPRKRAPGTKIYIKNVLGKPRKTRKSIIIVRRKAPKVNISIDSLNVFETALKRMIESNNERNERQIEIIKEKLGNMPTPSIAVSTADYEVPEEETTFRLVQLYFKDFVRHGRKIRFSLDEIIDSYLYILAKSRKKEWETTRMKKLTDEEVGYRLIELYFNEVARLGIKRSLDLDSVLKAYTHTLHRLNRKEYEIEKIFKKN